MKSYRRLQKLIIIVLLGYAVIGYSFHILKLRELYPIFSWELFSVVPAQERIDFGLLITSVNGEQLPEPVYFEDADFLFGKAHTVDAYGSIQVFAAAIIRDDDAETEEIRTYFESIFLDEAESMSYQIIRRKADLLALWQTGQYDEETVIATFDKE
jgi:hypothetical protein